ncbi:MAG: DbpA RNA binding domain-containing protein, partial [Rhodobacteraceae bacterium]|nr:DbpA RNA binding domain-containing protein [Paracoccaceae bacterium]
EAFGPSRWFAISVGRADRAEPRWILPMLCRAGNLGREDVGAIRVQETETFVEVLAARAPTLLAAAGASGKLEGGAVLRALDAPPFGPRGPAPKPEPRPAERPEAKPGKRPEKTPDGWQTKPKTRHIAPDVAADHGLLAEPQAPGAKGKPSGKKPHRKGTGPATKATSAKAGKPPRKPAKPGPRKGGMAPPRRGRS